MKFNLLLQKMGGKSKRSLNKRKNVESHFSFDFTDSIVLSLYSKF